MASPSWNHDDEGLLHAAHDTAGTPAAAAAAAARPSPTVHRRRALQPPPLPPWQRLRRALQGADPLAHIDCLGPLGPAARPSVLQPLARAGGAHAPSSLCRPQLALCGTQLADLPVDRAGHLQPLAAGVAQCHLHLSRVAVPHTGGWQGSRAVRARVQPTTASHHSPATCLNAQECGGARLWLAWRGRACGTARASTAACRRAGGWAGRQSTHPCSRPCPDWLPTPPAPACCAAGHPPSQGAARAQHRHLDL